MPGIFNLDGERLTICFNAQTGGKRPTGFDMMDDWMFQLTLMKAPPGFKEFPKEFTVKVTDPDGKPAGGATIATSMNLRPDREKKDDKPEWKLSNAVKLGADGTANIEFEELHHSRLWARDAEKKLVAIAVVSPIALLKNDLNIRLRPECKVVGTVECDQLKKFGRPINWVGVELMQDGDRIAFSDTWQGRFEFIVPSGVYTLLAYGSDVKTKRNTTITALPGQRELIVEPIAMTASKLVLMQGQPAPELTGVMGWKGKKTTLAKLKGKFVLLEFWGFWCGPCVQSMPELIELHEKFADKGLAIIGIHLDVEGDIDTAAKLDDKIAGYKKELWNGRDLPFPVALTSGKRVGEGDERTHGGAAAQYGVSGYPTTILIDRDGKVVGKFGARDAKDACAQVEKLLNAKK
jgi:thiol-disulfide isomerase/thioredoxin